MYEHTKKKITAIAKHLRTGGVALSHGHGLEMLANDMGYHSWNHMSEAIKREDDEAREISSRINAYHLALLGEVNHD